MVRGRSRTTRITLGPIPAAELKEAMRRLREERARRDACKEHQFVRVAQEPPRWFCPRCQSPADVDYVRGFASGVLAAGGDPASFIADYETWP